MAASVFLAAYEMLKHALVDSLRDFFADDLLAESGSTISAEYRARVLSLHKKEMVACAIFFQNWGALDAGDLAILHEIAQHRNLVAHELPSIIGSERIDVSVTHLTAILALTSKLDQWWFREVEATTNPDLANLSEEQLEHSASMRMVIMELLVEVALGDDSRLSGIYSKWMEYYPAKCGGES